MIQRKLTLVMENKPGALARVVGLFHQRGYNIDSLHVDPIAVSYTHLTLPTTSTV